MTVSCLHSSRTICGVALLLCFLASSVAFTFSKGLISSTTARTLSRWDGSSLHAFGSLGNTSQPLPS